MRTFLLLCSLLTVSLSYSINKDREEPVVRVFKEYFAEFSEHPEADADIAKSLTEETAQLLHQPLNEGHKEILKHASTNQLSESQNGVNSAIDHEKAPADSIEGNPLIYAESNRNRAGWLMPDASIPE